MRIRTLFSAMLALASLVALIPPVAAEDDKATEVLSAARKAIGGKLESLKTLSVQAALQRNMNNVQLASDVEILLDLPDRYLRSDASGGMMNMTVATGFNGEKPIRPANAVSLAGGGMMVRMGGPSGPSTPAEKLSPEEQEKVDRQLLRSTRADISRLMLGWFAMAHPALNVEYTYAGEAESPDGKAHVIDAKTADGFTARLFIDQESKLPLMVTYQGPQPRVILQGGPRRPGEAPSHGGQAGRSEMTEDERKKMRDETEQRLKEMQSQPMPMADFSLYFDDWRDVDGMRFPHRIRRAISGSTNEEWTINKVKVNPKIDPKKFAG
jgi:hypothetical protein